VRCLNRRMVLLLTLILAATLIGCSKGADVSALHEQPVIAILVDGTINTPAIREHHLAEIRRAIDQVPDGTRLVIFQITANSGVSPVLFDHTFERPNHLLETAHAANVRGKKARAEVLTAIEQVLSAPPGREGTTVIDALAHARQYLNAVTVGSLAFVIVSDMMEQSELTDLTRVDWEASEELLGHIEATGRLPDLSGTCLYVTGIADGDDPGSWMTPEHLHQVRLFWERLIATAGGALKAYGPSLSAIEACADGRH
jgi:hypothetical protein